MLPEGWSSKPISHLGGVVTGTTPPTKDPTNYGDDLCFASPADIGEHKWVHNTERRLSERGASIVRTLPERTTLFVCIGSTIGKVGISSVRLATNQQINAVVPHPDVDPEYLYYQLSIRSKHIARLAGTQAVPIINKSQFSSEVIALPNDKAEQSKIAEILATWDQAIETVDKLIDNARARKKALMQQLLTGKRRLPGSEGAWSEVRLGERGSFRKGRGVNKDRLQTEGVPYVRYGELYTIHHEQIQECGSFLTPEDASYCEPIAAGDVLFAISGETPDEIGKCAVFLGGHQAYAGGDIVIFRPEHDDPRFLGYALNAAEVNRQTKRFAQGVSVVHVSVDNLANLEVTMPPLDEQRKIAACLDAAKAAVETLQSGKRELEKEKRALMQQLLTGKRRVKVEEAV